eukprot:Opistho-2@56276
MPPKGKVKEPYGRKPQHKGRQRHFTSGLGDEGLSLEEQERQQKQQEWRRKKGEDSEDEDEEEGSDEDDSDEDDSDEKEETEKGEGAEADGEEKQIKPKGVQSLIETENPNRLNKAGIVKKADAVNVDVKPELSRREREEIEKEQARRRYEELHRQGKTEQAQADLARLALIRKQREDAAKKRADVASKGAVPKGK